jgi:plastocyanin
MKRAVLLAVPVLAGVLVIGAGAQQRPAAAPAAQPAAARTVRMLMQGSRYLFDPANFSIRQGETAEFVNVSGMPHNVQFDGTKIPAGAADVMNRNMPTRLGPLQGPMMPTVNQKYRVSFAGAPVGTYDYFCLPHRALNMKGVITVTAAAPARR